LRTVELSVNIYFFRMHRVSRQNSLNIKRAMNDGMFSAEKTSLPQMKYSN